MKSDEQKSKDTQLGSDRMNSQQNIHKQDSANETDLVPESISSGDFLQQGEEFSQFLLQALAKVDVLEYELLEAFKEGYVAEDTEVIDRIEHIKQMLAIIKKQIDEEL